MVRCKECGIGLPIQDISEDTCPKCKDTQKIKLEEPDPEAYKEKMRISAKFLSDKIIYSEGRLQTLKDRYLKAEQEYIEVTKEKLEYEEELRFIKSLLKLNPPKTLVKEN